MGPVSVQPCLRMRVYPSSSPARRLSTASGCPVRKSMISLVSMAPVAAILPFVDVGLAEDANCSALTARAGKPGPKVATPEAAAKPAGKPASKPAASR